MDLKQALDQAYSAIQLAEEAADAIARQGYLRVAKECLTQADIDEWVQRKTPTVILAVE